VSDQYIYSCNPESIIISHGNQEYMTILLYRYFVALIAPWRFKIRFSDGPNSVGVSHPSLEDGNKSGFRNVVFFSVLENSRRWAKSKSPVIPTFKVYFHSKLHIHNINFKNKVRWFVLFTGAARSKAWTVFARSNAEIVGSNPTRSMDVCVRLFCVCVVLCVGRGLGTGWSPVQGVVPTVYRSRNWKSGQGPQGL
jgi:hypothetical protein